MDAIKEYLRAVDRLEHGEINLGEYEKLCEPLRDVVEVKHGEWEVHRFIPENSNSGVTYTRCSICGNLPMLNPYSKEEELTNFCPYCGADMRGEREDEHFD